MRIRVIYTYIKTITLHTFYRTITEKCFYKVCAGAVSSVWVCVYTCDNADVAVTDRKTHRYSLFRPSISPDTYIPIYIYTCMGIVYTSLYTCLCVCVCIYIHITYSFSVHIYKIYQFQQHNIVMYIGNGYIYI